MKSVFVDTSALYALLDADDAGHATAKSTWLALLQADVRLHTSNYILIEASALVQNRLGLDAVRVLQEDIVPLFTIHYIDADLHHAAVSAHLAADQRRLSLVDCSSFEVMRRGAMRTAFTLDRHFRDYRFETIPAGS